MDENCAALVRLQGAMTIFHEPERRLQLGLELGGVIGWDLLSAPYFMPERPDRVRP
jgi:hypothetical protein